MNGLFQTKSIELSIKDIDTAGRRVKVALSAFGNVDSDGDIITRGAFAKSIQERGHESQSNRKIKFLRYHDFEHEIGVWKSLEESHDHLIGIGDLGRSTKGTDAFLDYQDGIITEHSIGFISIPDKIKLREDGLVELNEVFLMEGSAVTFGANSETPVFSVSGKDQFSEEYLDKLNKRMNGLINALKNGKGTDERLITIESQLKVIQSKYNSLINFEPKAADPAPLDVDKPNELNNNKQFYINQLIK
jgi:HK97 family phage prohead protease